MREVRALSGCSQALGKSLLLAVPPPPLPPLLLPAATALSQHSLPAPAEYAFPPGLSNHDRAVVHAECKKYGFSSKSHG